MNTVKNYAVVGGFSERIREVVLGSDMDLTVVAKRLQIPRSTIWGYMYNDIMPNSMNLYKIASNFHVSTDWLLGLTDEKTDTRWIPEELNKRQIEEIGKEQGKIAVANFVKSIRLKKGMSQRDFAEFIGVSEKTVFLWEKETRIKGKIKKLRDVDKEKVGESIKKFRESKGMTRFEFAEYLGVEVRTVGYWETGKSLPTEMNRYALQSIGWEGLNGKAVFNN